MRKYLLTFFLVSIVVFCVIFFTRGKEAQSETVKKAEQLNLNTTLAEPKLQMTEYIIKDDDVFNSAMKELGFSYSDALDILNAASSTYDFTKIRVGRPLRLYKTEAGENAKLEYEKDAEEIVTVNFIEGNYQAEIVTIKYDIQTQTASGVITSSLWESGLEAGMADDLIMKFAAVFDWTVDFGMGVQSGDSFELVYEKRYRDGQYVGTGKVLAGKFVNDETEYRAYLFADPDGSLAYYNEKGESMRRQFLRAPLEYKYISSGFQRARVDPISGHVAGHRAIDYAAALGTPVRAVGDGAVESAGWNSSGLGNFISIHHTGAFTTQYGHLSAHAKGIKRGAKVKQGQVIGFVGSTGHSTGPHLHYQVLKNGQFVNSQTIEFPPGDPVSADRRADFEQARQKYDQMLK